MSVELSSVTSDRIYYFESVENTSESKVNAHYHDLFEIYYLTYGSCNYFIDNKSYKLKQGDIVLIPEGVIHKTNYSSSTHSRMLINCSPEFIPSSVYEVVAEGAHVFRNTAQRGEIDAIFKQIKQEYSQNDKLSSDALLSCLSYLFIRILRICTTEIGADNEISCAEKAVGFVQDNYMNKITLSDSAKYCSVSSEHLSRSFKKKTGVGFNEYLVLFRLNKAEAMLVNQPGFSISDIAYRCGFDDSNYFSSVFKKNYGISPSEKRKKALKTKG